MVPMQLIVYSAFLREKLHRCRYSERDIYLECTDCFPTRMDLSSKRALQEMAEDYRKIYGDQSSRMEEFLRKWPEGMEVEAFRRQISKINRTLREGLEDETQLPFYFGHDGREIRRQEARGQDREKQDPF